MTPRDRRPDNERGPVNWGIVPKKAPRAKNTSTRPGGNGRLEVIRPGNNPAPSGSSASAASATGSADGGAGSVGSAGRAAVMTEEDMRSAAAQAIASGTADAVDAAIAIDLADAADDDTVWAGSAASPASPVSMASVGFARGYSATKDRIADSAEPVEPEPALGNTANGTRVGNEAAVETAAGDGADSDDADDTGGPVDESRERGGPVPTAAPVAPPGNSSASASSSAAAAANGQDGVAAGSAASENRSRPVVRPTAVEGPSSPQTATTTTRVFTISQGRPTSVPSDASGADAPQPAPAAARSAASAPAPDAGRPSASGYGYQARPSAPSGAAPNPASQAAAATTRMSTNMPSGTAAAADPEEDAGILAESSAWEAATNALDTEEIKAQGGGTDWGVGHGPAKGRGPRRPSSGTDWGVGRGSAKGSSNNRTRSPWPAAVRRQRLAGVAFALMGLVLATVSAMNLARNAEAGHLWIPPWLVAVLGGAGLVAAAGYLAWAGGTPLRREAERWKPGVLDAAAGLTTGTVKVHDPARLVARARGPLLLGSSERADETAPTVDSGPRPVMGTSTVDQSTRAPAGVAGAVGGFMLASAVVCAVVALILGPSWLIATAALTLGGIVAIRLAGEWLGQV